ncbi:MAG: methyl-accepting chemotaxis protein [Arcobacter sp.]|nr:methyl-accepting chemotaxis protein [Arcobacter sp.]
MKILFLSKVHSFTKALLITIGILIIPILILSFFVGTSFSNPIKILIESSSKIAKGEGDVKVHFSRKDEFRELADSFNKMANEVEISQADNKLSSEKLLARETELKETVASLEVNDRYLSDSVENLLLGMERIKNGYLDINLSSSKDDVIAKLFNGFTETAENIEHTLTHVRDAANKTAEVAQVIYNSADEISCATVDQSTQISDVVASVQEMASAIALNSQNTQETARVTVENEKIVKRYSYTYNYAKRYFE